MKRISIFVVLACCVQFSIAYGQLTVEACQEKAKTNYPLVKQYDLIKRTENYSLANANKGYLPQVSISGKATYQSDVTALPIKLPGIIIPSLSKDQYQAAAEVNQLLWDGGAIGAQKQAIKASTVVDQQKTEVDLYALNDRVNQLYFGILSLDEQLRQNELLQKELQTNLEQITSYLQNGIANQADVDAIKVEQLKTKQNRTQLQSIQKTYREMLSVLIGETVGETTRLTKPESNMPTQNESNHRPELKLFDAQDMLYASQRNTITSGNLPKISLFVQGGLSRPGLNMLNNEFSPYYIGGVRFSWNLGGFYSQKNNLHKIVLNQKTVNVQKEAFLFNSQLTVLQQKNEIEKIRTLITDDDEIITLRHNIKKAAQEKVANGTLSVSELIREIDDESLAMQDKSLHEIQLLMAIYDLKNTINN